MSKGATLTDQEARYKAQAQTYLAEARRILRELSTERRREERRRRDRPDLLTEVRAILRPS